MKKCIVVALVTCMALGFTGCGATDKKSTSETEKVMSEEEKKAMESRILGTYFEKINEADFASASTYTQNEDLFRMVTTHSEDKAKLEYSLTDLGEVGYNTLVEELCKGTKFTVGDYIDQTSGGIFEYACTVEVPKPVLTKSQKSDFKKRLKKKVTKYYTGEVNDEELNRYILKLVKSTIKKSFEGTEEKKKINLTLGETTKDGVPTVSYASQMIKKMYLSADLTGYIDNLSNLVTKSLEATIKD